jgi:hypothetical protein
MKASWKRTLALATVVGIGVGATASALTRSGACDSTRTKGAGPAAPSDVPATPPAAPAMTEEQAAEAYLAAVAPVNVAQAAFYEKTQRWFGATSIAQAESDARPLLEALADVKLQLQSIAGAYPPAATQLGDSFTAVSVVERDLRALGSLNHKLSVQSWRERYEEDIATLIAVSNGVRSTLGLPPVRRPSPQPLPV